MIASVNCVTFDPNRKHFEPYGLTCERWEPSIMPRPDHHNEVEVNFIREGAVTYLLGGQKVTVGAGRLSLFWGAIPHQLVEYTSSQPYLVATIPLHSFLQWRLPQGFVQTLMQGQLLCDVPSAPGHSDSELIERWVQDLTSPNPEAELLVMLEMQARITRFAMSYVQNCDDKSPAGVAASKLSKVEQMACFIAKNYTQKVTVQQVAEEVGLKPNYAMNLFQKTFGTTLISHLTQHRLSHAQRLLTTTEEAITEVALQSGFQSISRFNDVFNQAFGCSPRGYRKLHEETA